MRLPAGRDFGMRNQKSVAAAFIADEISILKDHENVYYFLLCTHRLRGKKAFRLWSE
jgi:hypothetical protein